MKSRTAFPLLFAATVVGGCLFRLPQLAVRPMHADEAVQAARFRQLWQQGEYRYDPDEFHGPTLPYFTLPSVWLGNDRDFGQTTETTYRIVPVIFGVSLIALLWPLREALGKPALLVAGILTALSPAMVFYSRYYIHETLFVFFAMAVIVSAWQYLRTRSLVWCLAAGAGLGLMQATKETSVIVYAAMGSSLAVAALWTYWTAPDPDRRLVSLPPWWHLVLGIGVALLVAATLLSSFFTNPRGPMDGVLTYLPWLRRAGGDSPHVHPWHYYVNILTYWRVGDGPWWSELLILGMASFGLVVALIPGGAAWLPNASLSFLRWLSLYWLLLLAAYSAIPYKTPWCVLGPLHAMILGAGAGCIALVRCVPTQLAKTLVAVLLLAAAVHLGWQSYRASYVAVADPGNPYLYAPTSPDMIRLAEDVDQLLLASSDGQATVIKVIWTDHYYWPLPWYLRDLEHVGYWSEVPTDPRAPVVICSPQWDAQMTAHLDATHLMTDYYELRPNVLAQLWVEMDLWEQHLKRLGRL